jgi:outer membrane protein assembly factor BamD
MRSWLARLLWIGGLLAFSVGSRADLVYRPGEGWTYETPGGGGKWVRERARDQLEVAQEAFKAKNYGTAIKAANRVVKVWPTSEPYAPEAQYLLGRCYVAKRNDEKAFKQYQKLVDFYPKSTHYEEVLREQFEIANRFLAGQWFRLWGFIPLFSSMDRTAQLYEQIIRNGPYSPVAPQSQLNIGVAREKQVNFFNRIDPFQSAVRAYETAADRYFDNKPVAAQATFKAGEAYYRLARKAEYDQSAAGQAISRFTDFIALFPNDPRVEEAQSMMATLRAEQARGFFELARYYEKRKVWAGALIYYNEAYSRDPRAPFAEQARQKIDEIRKRIEQSLPKKT